MTQETLLQIGKLGLAIEDGAAEYIKNRLGEVIDEHCKSLEACISALGDAVTVKGDKPDRKAKSPSKEAQ